MIIDLAIAYDISFLPKRARIVRIASLRDTTPVQVQELNTSRVVLRVDDHEWHEVDGNLYYLWPVAPEALATFEVDNHGCIDQSSKQPVDAETAPENLKIAEIRSTDLNAAVAAANARAAELRIVAGGVLVPSRGPTFVLVPPEVGSHSSSRRDLKLTDPVGSGPTIRDGTAMTVAEALEVDHLARHLGVVLATRPAIEMIDATLMLQSRAVERLAMMADRFLIDDVPNRAIYNMPCEHIDAWVKYRAPSFDRNDLDAIAEVLAGAVANKDIGDYKNKAGDALMGMFKEVEAALFHWEASKRNLDVDAPTLQLSGADRR